MSKHLSITSVVAFMLVSGAVASAQDLPTYESMGFPVTPLQISILGCSGSVQEQTPTPTNTTGGLPASPHQIAVLTPRLRDREADQRLANARKTKFR
jgi:hypothetical protein